MPELDEMPLSLDLVVGAVLPLLASRCVARSVCRAAAAGLPRVRDPISPLSGDAARWALELGGLHPRAAAKVFTARGMTRELQHAVACGFEMDWMTCSHAARGGHLETLMWAREAGCPWNVGTTRAAALGGHLETLKWAREAGCPLDECVC